MHDTYFPTSAGDYCGGLSKERVGNSRPNEDVKMTIGTSGTQYNFFFGVWVSAKPPLLLCLKTQCQRIHKQAVLGRSTNRQCLPVCRHAEQMPCVRYNSCDTNGVDLHVGLVSLAAAELNKKWSYYRYLMDPRMTRQPSPLGSCCFPSRSNFI